jgi:hypothetical protein
MSSQLSNLVIQVRDLLIDPPLRQEHHVLQPPLLKSRLLKFQCCVQNLKQEALLSEQLQLALLVYELHSDAVLATTFLCGIRIIVICTLLLLFFDLFEFANEEWRRALAYFL